MQVKKPLLPDSPADTGHPIGKCDGRFARLADCPGCAFCRSKMACDLRPRLVQNPSQVALSRISRNSNTFRNPVRIQRIPALEPRLDDVLARPLYRAQAHLTPLVAGLLVIDADPVAVHRADQHVQALNHCRLSWVHPL